MFATVGLQPFHRGPAVGSPSGAAIICGAQRDTSRAGACAYTRDGAITPTTINAEIAENSEKTQLLADLRDLGVDGRDLIRIVII